MFSKKKDVGGGGGCVCVCEWGGGGEGGAVVSSWKLITFQPLTMKR